MIRQLPNRYALLIRGGYSPVIARLPMAWRDRTYRAARREGTAAAPQRTPGLLASQAEWHTRLLPALAEQMYLETTRCQWNPTRAAQSRPNIG